MEKYTFPIKITGVNFFFIYMYIYDISMSKLKDIFIHKMLQGEFHIAKWHILLTAAWHTFNCINVTWSIRFFFQWLFLKYIFAIVFDSLLWNMKKKINTEFYYTGFYFYFFTVIMACLFQIFFVYLINLTNLKFFLSIL